MKVLVSGTEGIGIFCNPPDLAWIQVLLNYRDMGRFDDISATNPANYADHPQLRDKDLSAYSIHAIVVLENNRSILLGDCVRVLCKGGCVVDGCEEAKPGTGQWIVDLDDLSPPIEYTEETQLELHLPGYFS